MQKEAKRIEESVEQLAGELKQIIEKVEVLESKTEIIERGEKFG